LLNKRIARRRKKVQKILDKANYHIEQIRQSRGHDDEPVAINR